MVSISRKIYFYFDDSGVFHKNESSGCFVYAGFVFFDRETRDCAKRKYTKALKDLDGKLKLGREYKAAFLAGKHKRFLFNSVKEFQSLSMVVKLDRVYNSILSDLKSRCRFKDYVLKRGIKQTLEDAVNNRIICKEDDVELVISIDEQLTATNGYYSLQDSIKEELKYGITNFDYSKVHKPIFTGNVSVRVMYCDSSKNHLIQASDILANRIRASYCKEDVGHLREIVNHKNLTFP